MGMETAIIAAFIAGIMVSYKKQRITLNVSVSQEYEDLYGEERYVEWNNDFLQSGK